MVPPFDDAGCLPPGVHRATLAEIEDCFGHRSELRRVQMESVRWMVDLAGQTHRLADVEQPEIDQVDPRYLDDLLQIAQPFLALDKDPDQSLGVFARQTLRDTLVREVVDARIRRQPAIALRKIVTAFRDAICGLGRADVRHHD